MKLCYKCKVKPVKRKGYCTDCRREYMKKYRKENREKINEYNALWMQDYRDKLNIQ